MAGGLQWWASTQGDRSDITRNRLGWLGNSGPGVRLYPNPEDGLMMICAVQAAAVKQLRKK